MCRCNAQPMKKSSICKQPALLFISSGGVRGGYQDEWLLEVEIHFSVYMEQSCCWWMKQEGISGAAWQVSGFIECLWRGGQQSGALHNDHMFHLTLQCGNDPPSTLAPRYNGLQYVTIMHNRACALWFNPCTNRRRLMIHLLTSSLFLF